MIEKTVAFRFGDTVYSTFKDAQIAGLTSLLDHALDGNKSLKDKAALEILDRKDEVIAILTGTKPRKPRADRGKSHRKPQAPAEVKDSPEPGVLPGVKVEASSKYRNK